MAGESSDMLEREGKAAARLVPNCVRSMRYAFKVLPSRRFWVRQQVKYWFISKLKSCIINTPLYVAGGCPA